MAERRISEALPLYVTLSDHHAMLRCCTSARDRLLLHLLWVTGGRVSEVLQIRAGDLTRHGIRLVNLKQGRWVKQEDGSKPKHISIRKEKHVTLPRSVLAELQETVKGLSPDACLITHLDDSHPISRRRAHQIVTGLAAQAGVFKRRFDDGELRAPSPHAYRHGHAIRLMEEGIPFIMVSEQLGHANPASTQIYTKIVNPHKAELMERVRF